MGSLSFFFPKLRRLGVVRPTRGKEGKVPESDRVILESEGPGNVGIEAFNAIHNGVLDGGRDLKGRESGKE